MKFGLIELLTLIGSVGIFLYGMKLMSEGLQKAAGDKLRNILAKVTNNRFIGALTGLLITALIQSSSATTVMIVSFVNAGLMSLAQSMAVIMGANVGTTATAWIISLFGFKVNIAAFAIPLVGFAVPMMFAKKDTWKNWGEFLLGFALLFLGLEYLSNSVPDLQSNPEMFSFLQKYSKFGFGSVLLFSIFGMILTIVVQSSSATFAIVLIMCSKGWVSFEIAAAMVLGSNIGTCITPIIASISGNIQAKRAAMGHLLFNVLGSIWTIILFSPFLKLITQVSTFITGDPTLLMSFVNETDSATLLALNDGTLDTSLPGNEVLATQFAKMQYDVSFGLSVFHTIFNIINIMAMIWLTKFFVFAVTKLVPSKPNNEEENHLRFISTGMLSTSELSLFQATKEITLYAERTQNMQGFVRDLFHMTDEKVFVQIFSRIQKYENISDRMEIEIANYLNNVSNGRLSNETKHRLHSQFRVVSEIESIGDGCYNIARTIHRRMDSRTVFTQEQTENIELMFNLVDSAFSQMLYILKKDDVKMTDINRAHNIESEINNLRDQLKTQNILNINEGKYQYHNGIIYLDIIVECEKIGDYIINVVEASAEGKINNNTTLKL